MEHLASQGHLDQWIDRTKIPHKHLANTALHIAEQRLSIIHVIHGLANKETEAQLRSELDQVKDVETATNRDNPLDNYLY